MGACAARDTYVNIELDIGLYNAADRTTTMNIIRQFPYIQEESNLNDAGKYSINLFHKEDERASGADHEYVIRIQDKKLRQKKVYYDARITAEQNSANVINWSYL